MEYLPIPLRFFHTMEDIVGVSTGFRSGARVLHAVPLDAVVGSCGSTLLLKERMERLSVLGRVSPTEAEAVDAEEEDTIISAQHGRTTSSSSSEWEEERDGMEIMWEEEGEEVVDGMAITSTSWRLCCWWCWWC